VPPPAGAISLVPAGSPHWVRSSGCKDELHICLEPRLVERVAAEAFGLDPVRLTVPTLDGLDVPDLRAAMGAIGVELTVGAAGGWLAAAAPRGSKPTLDCWIVGIACRPSVASRSTPTS
jgi:hypothetical protein